MWLNSLAMKQNRLGPGVMKSNMVSNSMFVAEHYGPNSGQSSNWLMNHMSGQHPGVPVGSGGVDATGSWSGQQAGNAIYNPMNSPIGQAGPMGNPGIGGGSMASPIGSGMPSQHQYPMGIGQGQHQGMGPGQPHYPMMPQHGGGSQANSHVMGAMSPNPLGGMQQPTLTGE